MKKIFALITLYLTLLPAFSQLILPDNINYQAVVRDNLGAVLANQSVNFRFTFIRTATSAVVYQETQLVSTNSFGLVNIGIGTGTPVFGAFSSIDFHQTQFSLRVDIDPTGGNSFTLVGTSVLTGVPYAQYAEKARTVEFNDDADADPSNEFQNIIYNTATQQLSLTNGNSVTLNVKDSDSSPTNELQTLSYNSGTQMLSLSNGNNVFLNVNDADASPTNELQTLSFANDKLTISSGNFVTFPWSDVAAGVYTNQNVGIGTNTPGFALDVVGKVRASVGFDGDGTNLTNVTAVMADSLSGSMQADSGDVLEWDGNQWTPRDNRQIAFSAYASSTQTIPATSYAIMSFPNTTGHGFDESGGGYDNSTNMFTAPADGIYSFHTQVNVTGTPGTGYSLNLLKNSVQVRTNAQVYAHSVPGSLSLQVSAVLKLNAGDIILINMYNSGSSSVNTYSFQGKYVYFSGYRIY